MSKNTRLDVKMIKYIIKRKIKEKQKKNEKIYNQE